MGHADKKRLGSLDLCRGIAILMVVGFHASLTYPPSRWIARVAELGNMGVQLFFLVSAVTMCHMWEQRHEESNRALKFYIRRFFRIAPLFWFAIIFYTLLWHMQPGLHGLSGITPLQIVLTATFLHPFAPSAINSVVPGGWSIGIEMGFYVIFPILVSLRQDRLLVFAFASYLLLGVAGTYVAEGFGSGEPYAIFLYYSFLTQLPIFPIGMFVYATTHRQASPKPIQTSLLIMLWLLIAFIAKGEFHLTARPFLWLEIALLAGFVWCSIHWSWGSRFLSFLGRLSYSMYLFHFAVLYFLERLFGDGWPFPIGFAATLSATILIAKLSQQSAEKWSQDAGRTLIGALERRNHIHGLPVKSSHQ